MDLSIIKHYFSPVTDQRQTAKITYPIFDILFVSLCAVTAGANGWKEIHEYAEGHLEWFQENDILREGVPVDDTVARAIAKIKPDEFNQCFVNWMKAVHKLTNGEVIAIDGKTLKGSYDREDRLATLHMINAFACENKLVLGQLSTDCKSNEITAIPELLRLLDIKGALVSIDAMGCQKKIAETIVEQKADYLLAVKGNQGSLHTAIKDMFKDFRSTADTTYEIEKNRSRLEARCAQVLCAKKLAKDFPQWPKLKTVAVSMGYRQEKGKEPGLQYRYYISSAELTEETFSKAVRQHWAVENSLHWVLDLTMNEDDCQIYKDNSAENMAVMRQVSLNMLQKENSKKRSIVAKRRRAWMKTSYLEEVLKAGFNAAG